MMVSPALAPPRKLVLLSSVVVRAPGARLRKPAMAPRVSANAM